MIGWVLLEGLGLGILLVLVCAFGIRKGAVGMVHLYHTEVQERCVELGLTTQEAISGTASASSCAACPAISSMCWSSSTPSMGRGALGPAFGSCSVSSLS